MKVEPVSRRRAPPQTYPLGRGCETDGCDTRLSRYTDDRLCWACHDKIPLAKLPTTGGRYL